MPPSSQSAVRSLAERLTGHHDRALVDLLFAGEAPLVPGLVTEPVGRPEQAKGFGEAVAGGRRGRDGFECVDRDEAQPVLVSQPEGTVPVVLTPLDQAGHGVGHGPPRPSTFAQRHRDGPGRLDVASISVVTGDEPSLGAADSSGRSRGGSPPSRARKYLTRSDRALGARLPSGDGALGDFDGGTHGQRVATEQAADGEQPFAVVLDRAGGAGDELPSGVDDKCQVAERQLLQGVGDGGEVTDVAAGIGGGDLLSVPERLPRRLGLVEDGVDGQPNRGERKGIGLVRPLRLGPCSSPPASIEPCRKSQRAMGHASSCSPWPKRDHLAALHELRGRPAALEADHRDGGRHEPLAAPRLGISLLDIGREQGCPMAGMASPARPVPWNPTGKRPQEAQTPAQCRAQRPRSAQR